MSISMDAINRYLEKLEAEPEGVVVFGESEIQHRLEPEQAELFKIERAKKQAAEPKYLDGGAVAQNRHSEAIYRCHVGSVRVGRKGRHE